MFSFLEYFRHSFNCISPDGSVCPQPDSLAWWLGGWDRSPWMAHGTMAPASFLPPNPPTETPQLPPALRPATSATNIAANIATNIASNLATKTNTANIIITANRHAKASEMPVSKRRKRMKDVNGFLLHTILISICLLRSTSGGFFSCFLPLLFEKPSHWSLISSRSYLADWPTDTFVCAQPGAVDILNLCGNQQIKGLYQIINTKDHHLVRGSASLQFCLVPMNLCICIKRSGLWQPNNTAAHFSFRSTLHFKRIAQLQTKSWEAIRIILFWPFELLRCYLLPKWSMHFWKREKKKIAT